MRTIVAVAACFIVAAALPPSPSEALETRKHYEESLIAAGEKGLFTIEMLFPKGGLIMGANDVEVILHDSSGKDVPGAELTVEPGMPAHGHGVEEKPVVLERGGGVYSIENIVLTMTGWWEVAVSVRKGELTDRAVFSFADVGAGHGSGDKGAVPSELLTEVLSEKGHFTVRYETTPAPVPLNTIHLWSLTVTGADGVPVKGALISVQGDMTEHGHGLPTQPELTEERSDGVYTIEGMKFSMPGWWAVTFSIAAGEVRDTATFNLRLSHVGAR